MGHIWFKTHISRPQLSVTKTDGQLQTNLCKFYGALILQHPPTVYALSAWLLKARTPFVGDYSTSGGFILNNTIKWRWWCAVILPTLSKFTVKRVSVRDVLSCRECFNQPGCFFCSFCSLGTGDFMALLCCTMCTVITYAKSMPLMNEHWVCVCQADENVLLIFWAPPLWQTGV